MVSDGVSLHGVYDYRLVCLSVLISGLASYSALEVAGRVNATQGKARLAWLTGGACAMGTGIWSMHYIGMLAFRLPVAVLYDWPTVLLSLFSAVAASWVALFVVSREEMGWLRSLFGSLAMGSGIAGMHYIGMAAMRLPAECTYSSALVVLSVGLAILISLAALWLTFRLRDETKNWRWQKVFSAVLMGTAIPIMHYTGMAAASFTPADKPPNLAHAIDVSSLGLAGIVFVTIIVLGVALSTSIIDRRFAEQALALKLERRYHHLVEAANVVKTEFLHNMSHEILTPLNAVLGMAQFMLDTDLSQEQREYMELLKVSGDSLVAVLKDILEFSRIEAGHLELDQVEFKPREISAIAVQMFASAARHKGLKLYAEVAPDVPEVLIGDPGRIRQVLFNLVGNAAKFTFSGKIGIQVEIAAATPLETRLCFAVSDTGIGVAPEKQQAIFEAFSQADNSSTRKFGGAGLGLAICRRLVGLMGGTIELQSQPGLGSQFRFTVPFPASSEAPASAKTAALGS